MGSNCACSKDQRSRDAGSEDKLQDLRRVVGVIPPGASLHAKECPKDNRAHLEAAIDVPSDVSESSTADGLASRDEPMEELDVRSESHESLCPDEAVWSNIESPDGLYIGYCLEKKAHGYGRYESKQSEYKGDWHRGLKHGHGEEVRFDLWKYSGQYARGAGHGEGTLTWKDGRIYRGEFRGDQQHGHGRLELPDGRVYEGGFVQNTKEGTGTFYWRDGRKWIGQFKKDQLHGKGVMHFANGEERSGEWSEGKLVGWDEECQTKG